MKKSIDISLIVPVYNADKWLTKCIDSILRQTYKNFEIIIIDDGSTDNSPKICDQYAKKDNRINVYHIENGGVSNARNFGLNKSKGNYIMFIDSDDWIEENCIEEMIRLIEIKKVDLVKFNYFRNKTETESIIDNNYDEFNNKILTKKEINVDVINQILSNKIQAYLWTMIIKRKYAIQFKFDKKLGLMEDTLYFLELLMNINNMYIDNRAYYHYRYVENSASNNPKKIERNIDNVILINKTFNELSEKYKQLLNHKKTYNATHSLIIEYYLEILYNNNHKQFEVVLEKIFNEKKLKNIYYESDKRQIKVHKRILLYCIINNKKSILNAYYNIKKIIKRR